MTTNAAASAPANAATPAPAPAARPPKTPPWPHAGTRLAAGAALVLALALVAAFASALPFLHGERAQEAWAAPVNYGNPFENGDFARELQVDGTYFGYKMAGVVINVGGIQRTGGGPGPYDYPQVLVDYTNAVLAAGRTTGYGSWGVSDFALVDVSVAQNSRDLVFSALPTTSHCCQHDNETTYDYPRTAYLLLIEEKSSWSADGGTYHACFALATRNLGSTMGLWDQGTLGSAYVWADWVVEGGLEIQKSSSMPDVVAGNACYSLAGAQFGVYREDGELAATLETDERGFASVDGLAPGTYTVKELSAPAGYAADAAETAVSVQAGKTAQARFTDTPALAPVTLWAKKADAETATGAAQGAAGLAGAQFTVCYYAGTYDAENLPATPTRSWMVETGADGKATADEAHLVAGDELYRDAQGRVALPLGTVTVQETAPPAGYLLADAQGNAPELHVFHITAPAGSATAGGYNAPVQADAVARGGVSLVKVDRQSGLPVPQGAATLAGCTFEVVSQNAAPVVVAGNVVRTGQVAVTVAADEAGVATTGPRVLPVGAYLVRETAAPSGYLLDAQARSWSASFTIEHDGQMVDLASLAESASDRVVRGDFAFSKVEETGARRLGGVPFLVSSNTTGEAHVAVTDANGMLSTAASWNSHTMLTNGNDAALGESGAVDEALLDAGCGIWFSGSRDTAVAPDDALGALPYDTYTVSELPVAANEGLTLVSFQVTIERDGRQLDLGTVYDTAGPAIGTSLRTAEGAPTVAADGPVALVDTVRYENLLPGEPYTLRGALHALDAAGTDLGVVCEAATAFTPTLSEGSTEVEFQLDAGAAAAAGQCTFVAFERLENAQGVTVAAHEDLQDEGQTVRMPALGTALARVVPASADALALGAWELVDTVSFRNLAPGATYTVTGTLHMRAGDGTDLGPATDAQGAPVVAAASFTPADPDGTVEVAFSFTAPDLGGSTLVAFEELSCRGQRYAVHADISDETQTVRLPGIGTCAADCATGGHEGTLAETTSFTDTVAFANLEPGVEYTLSGVAMDARTGLPYEVEGQPVAGSTTFTPADAAGTVDVAFSFAGAAAEPAHVVVFETLEREGEPVAVHADLESAEQSVTYTQPPAPDSPAPTPNEPSVPVPDEPEPVAPDTPAPAPEPEAPQPAVQIEAPRNPRTVLPRTGDSLDVVAKVLAAIVVAAGALAAAAVATRGRGYHKRP